MDNVHLVTVNNSITELFEDRASELLIDATILPFGWLVDKLLECASCRVFLDQVVKAINYKIVQQMYLQQK